MKKLTLAILIVSLFSCTEKVDKKNSKVSDEDSSLINKPALGSNDKQGWIENFKEFRDAIYHHDGSKAKKFCNFPILNENNEIWYLIHGDSVFSSDRIIPFTERDFDNYFDKLFPPRFINSILKIKSDSLYKNGEYRTKDFKEGKTTSYGMHASFDKNKSTLTLNLWSNSIMKDENGEVLDGGEFSIVYQFSIGKDGKLIFNQIRLAG